MAMDARASAWRVCRVRGRCSGFARARALGVRVFPALLLGTGKRYIGVNPGYVDVADLEPRLRHAICQAGAAAA
jgi:putative protein-disulfide isomerase